MSEIINAIVQALQKADKEDRTAIYSAIEEFETNFPLAFRAAKMNPAFNYLFSELENLV